ncbi:peptidoglycan-binding domain-containing protein, partial [Mesorhizobium sp. M7A.F.Ca.ET.027.02.1.1]|uniref:peptidoglycan-binding domain-containing protein n=1 Tax=Mesorhizobium sp. M7A.F.Ca.ET.027.02.1.1 TaxID=2496655 RepID=UPI001AEC93D7
MVDFDRQVGFREPLLTPVFRAFNDDHLYFVLPNVLSLDALPTGAPDMTLAYDKAGVGKDAFLSLSGTVGFASDHAKAKDEIKSDDPAARFVVLEPSEFSFSVKTPGSDGRDAIINSAQIDSAGHFEVFAKVDDITSRILLLPSSYKFDAIAVIYGPVYRGVVRNSAGTPEIQVRPYSVGMVAGGGCALSPERYQSWATKQVGCKHPQYPRKLIREIQSPLKQAGLYAGGVDGIFGPFTEKAIREYQKSQSLLIDGIPSWELADKINGPQE